MHADFSPPKTQNVFSELNAADKIFLTCTEKPTQTYAAFFSQVMALCANYHRGLAPSQDGSFSVYILSPYVSYLKHVFSMSAF